MIEYSPFQKVTRRQVKDSREGTIESDADYLKFAESVIKPLTPLPSAEVQLEMKEKEAHALYHGKEVMVDTPLLKFLREKKALKAQKQALKADAKKAKRERELEREKERIKLEKLKRERLRQKEKEERRRKERDEVTSQATVQTSPATHGAIQVHSTCDDFYSHLRAIFQSYSLTTSTVH